MGLLDSFTNWAQSGNGQSQPVADGLLAAGLGILANNRGLTSGSQAIGMGGLQGLQQYQQSKQYGMQQQLQNAQLQQLGFGLQKNKMLLDMARGYLGGDQPQAAAPSAPGTMDTGGMPDGSQGSGPGVQSSPVPMGAPAPGGMPPSAPPQGGMSIPNAAPMPPQLANSQAAAQARGEAEYWAAKTPQDRAATAEALGYVPQQPQASQAAPQAAAPSPGGIFGNMPKGLVAYGLMTDPGKLFENAASQYSPTDLQKTMRAAGIDPGSDLGKQILQQNIAKTNNIPLVAGRAGAPMYRQDGSIASMAPKIPDNAVPVIQNGQVVGVSPLTGAANVEQINSYANAAGKAQTKPYAGVDAKGNPVPVTNELAAASGGVPLPMRNNNPGAVSPGGTVASYPDLQTGLAAMDKNLAGYAGQPGTNTLAGAITKWVGSPANAPAYIKDVSTRLGLPANAPVDLTNPAQRQAISTAIMLHENGPHAVFAQRGAQGSPAPVAQPIYAAPPMGAQANATAAADAQQSELSKSWSAQNDANTQAQTTASYLQQIKALAPKAATGPMSDRINYVNGLLSLAGSQKATDAVTANSLLDKYSNQIVARLGSGGMGTDAARSILASAYPGAHMNVDAINEASDNLVGAANMTQARQRILQPLANSRDPVAYNQAATKFDQVADPRIFQYENISDPTARKAFAQGLVKQDPTILNKIKSLHDMGAFPQ